MFFYIKLNNPSTSESSLTKNAVTKLPLEHLLDLRSSSHEENDK